MGGEQGSNLPVPTEIRSATGAISLRQFTSGDAREIFELIDRSRQHLSQHGEDTAIKYPTFESLNESIVHPLNPKRLRFAIRNKDGKIVGGINLTPESDDPKTGEIGYYLGAEEIGYGYASMAVEALTKFGFENLGYEVIYGKVAETNTPSIKVLNSTGFTEERRENGYVYLFKHPFK